MLGLTSKASFALRSKATLGRPSCVAAAALSDFARPQQPSNDYARPPYNGRLRAFPSYSVVNESVILQIKPLLPQFKVNGDLLTLRASDRGRLLFEWIPRSSDGKLVLDKAEQAKFALSVEEIGLCLDQLPHHPVELFRKAYVSPEQQEAADVTGTANLPEKVCRLIPGEAGMVTLSCDFELDGQGGQQGPNGELHRKKEAILQLGEFMVVKEIMRDSILFLSGWSTQSQIAMDRVVENSARYQDSQSTY